MMSAEQMNTIYWTGYLKETNSEQKHNAGLRALVVASYNFCCESNGKTP